MRSRLNERRDILILIVVLYFIAQPTNQRGWCISFYDGSFACLAEAEMKFAKCNDLAKKPQVQCLVSETAPKEVF